MHRQFAIQIHKLDLIKLNTFVHKLNEVSVQRKHIVINSIQKFMF